MYVSFDRYRKMKERMGMSELRKASNRMIFGEVWSFLLFFIKLTCSSFRMIYQSWTHSKYMSLFICRFKLSTVKLSFLYYFFNYLALGILGRGGRGLHKAFLSFYIVMLLYRMTLLSACGISYNYMGFYSVMERPIVIPTACVTIAFIARALDLYKSA